MLFVFLADPPYHWWTLWEDSGALWRLCQCLGTRRLVASNRFLQNILPRCC